MRRNAWLIAFVGVMIIIVATFIYLKRPHETPPTENPNTPLTQPIIRLTDPQRGPVNAPLTITVFTDFGCESCALVWPMIQALEHEPALGGKIRIVWKDFPAHKVIYPESYTLHKAARCAAVQGKFWEFQAAAFDHLQNIQNHESVLDQVVAAVHGLNASTLQACIDSGPIQDLVDADFNEGLRLSLTGTPTFFIGTKRIDGLIPYYALVGQVRNLLARTNMLY